ncbi:MAG: LapA family protein [Rhodospirillaceae bacterium]
MSVRRVLLTIGLLLALLFVSQNLDSIEIALVWGRPVEAPLALVIGVSVLVGFIAGLGVAMERRLRRGSRKAVEDEDYFAN